jgi:hypothetical protein
LIRSRIAYPALQGESLNPQTIAGLRPGSTINFLANDDTPPFRAGSVIGRPGPYRQASLLRACSGKLFTTENIATRFPDWSMDPARSLLRFVRKTPKNRRSGDFLPCKLRKRPNNRGFFAASSAKNPQVQQAASIMNLLSNEEPGSKFLGSSFRRGPPCEDPVRLQNHRTLE